MKTTDEDNSSKPITSPQWREFERNVADLISKLDTGAIQTRNAKLTGILSGRQREVDVLIEGTLAGSSVRISVECKSYNHSIGIGKIDEFVGKLHDLDVDKGIFYSFGPYSAGARARAAGAYHPKIELREWTLATPAFAPWSDDLAEFSKFGDCANENCLTGDITWGRWGDSEDPVHAGVCGSCGTWAIRCVECGDLVDVHPGTCECWCETRYEVTYSRKGDSIEDIHLDRTSIAG